MLTGLDSYALGFCSHTESFVGIVCVGRMFNDGCVQDEGEERPEETGQGQEMDASPIASPSKLRDDHGPWPLPVAALY